MMLDESYFLLSAYPMPEGPGNLPPPLQIPTNCLPEISSDHGGCM
jgi:hypothetical protein